MQARRQSRGYRGSKAIRKMHAMACPVSSARDALYFVTMSTMWALNYPLLKIALHYEAPLFVLLFRVGFGALFSFLIIGGIRNIPRGLRDNLLIMVTGLLNSALFMGFWFLGENTEPASVSSIIIYTFPIINVVLSYFFLSEKIGTIRVAGIALGFAGMFIIFAEELSLRLNIGLVYLGIAALVWSISAVIYKKYLGGRHVGAVNAMQFAYSVPFVLVWAAASERFSLPGVSIAFLLIVIYMGLFGSAYAYLIYFRLMRKYELTQISGMFFLVPAISVLLSYVLLGETNSLFTYLGFALISLGIYAGSRTDKKNLPSSGTADGTSP
jgi:drug/metabolite transporter (DMT)-like permease